MFRLLLLTAPTAIPDEPRLLADLLALGLDGLHLRKPGWPAGQRKPILRKSMLIALAAVLGLVATIALGSSLSSTNAPQGATLPPRRVVPAAKPAKPAMPAKPAAPSAKAPPARPKVKAPAGKRVPLPAVAPTGTAWVPITTANSGTVGAPYRIAAPRDFAVERGKRASSVKNDHLDLYLTDGGATQELGLLSFAWAGLPEGTLPPSLIKDLRGGWLTGKKGRVALAGTSVATIAGVRATGFDFTTTDPDGTKIHARVLFFGHGGTLHTALWFAPSTQFAATLPTFQHMVATMTFTGPAVHTRPNSTAT